jgi:threonylcarbamoyladenosine tRNA methylthiotransferase MtaB
MERMTRRPVASVLTLGCKLNLADSEELARGLRAAGYEIVDRLCEADAFVINTCSVTHVADQKSRRLIRSARRLSPGAPLAVTGCFPQSAGSEAAQALGADIVAGTRDADKKRIVDFLANRAPPPLVPAQEAPKTIHTRAFIKAQEGCNDVCAFCIVPQTRHREESRSVATVIAEVERAVQSGAREVVITGTQLGAWGRDLPGPLAPHHLIAGILSETDVARLRFSSLQPQDITPELLALWHDPRLMPHFHLALQSGSDAVLQRMRRRYTAAKYRAAAARIQAVVPAAAITTDVIAGFPGETEGDFRNTLALCDEVGVARIHAFPYSRRARTTATRLQDQLPNDVRKERMARLLALSTIVQRRFHSRFAGQTRPVLWEQQRETLVGPRWQGYTDNYIPVFAAGDALANRITPARLCGAFEDGLEALVVGGDL